MGTEYVINDIVINDLVDLLWVCPPVTYLTNGIKGTSELPYINWTIKTDPTLWVEAFISTDYTEIESIRYILNNTKPAIQMKNLNPEVALTMLTSAVLDWHKIAGIGNFVIVTKKKYGLT